MLIGKQGVNPGYTTCNLLLLREADRVGESEEFRAELQQELIRHYATLANVPDLPMVIQKLSATLVAYFLRPEPNWRHSVRDVIAAIFQHGSASQTRYLSGTSILTARSLVEPMKYMTYHQLRAILWFVSTLVDEVHRSDLKGARRCDFNLP